MNKTLNFKTLKTFLQLILLVVSIFGFSQTPVTYTANPNDTQITTALIGNNINITGGTLNFGNRATQIATFTGGNAAALQMDTGAFFGTGTVAKLLTTNNATQSTDDIPTTATFTDADLTAIDATATRDVVSYSFTVTLGPKATTLNIRYQFGSEEYPNFVGSAFNDVFGFFVTGPGIPGTTNLAKLPNGNPTSINKVNYGVPGAQSSGAASYDGSQSSLYTNNGHNTNQSGGKLVTNTNPGPFPVAVQFNGITKLITYSLSGLTPGGTYTFKIVIADAGGDASLDSGVFINTIYATATVVANNDTYTITSGSSSSTSVLQNDTVNGAAPASLSDVFLSQVSTTNTGVNLDPLTGKINVAAGTPAGTYTVTYQICDQTFTSNCKTATATITVQINDSDNDGIDNYYDLDDDNDGILDCDENLLGANASVSNVFSFVTAGTAIATSNNEVRLTQDTGNNAGQIWSVGKVDFTKSFVLRFDAYLGTHDDGADGIAAVFHNSPQGVNATGAAGSGIGARGIANGIVLELDTYNNGTSLGDISSDHGQIWDSDDQTSTGFLTTAVALPNLENSTWHPVVINWNATTKTISYTVDGTNAGTYTGDLVTNYFAGASKVYFGYTASTGASTNEQKIRINSFCSDLPLELDTDGDNIANSLDLDSDGDDCPDVIEGGANFTSGASYITNNALNTTVNSSGVPAVPSATPTITGYDQTNGQTVNHAYTVNLAAVAGTASSNQTICWNTAPSAITLTGYTGTIQWQSSTDNVTFTNISGATSASYSPGTLTSTTYYRAIVSSVGGCTVTSNTITITVNNCIDAVNDTYATVTPGTSTTSVITNDKNNSGTAAVIGTGAGQVSISTATDAAGTAGTWPTGFTLNADGTISVANGIAAGTYTLYYTICNQTAGPPCDTTSVTITVQVDTDGDGITDNLDLDDDNDGILDTNEGLCNISSTSSIDGFDSPVVPTINGNNIQNTNPYNGWRTETGGVTDFNVIRVNGAGYSSGPDVAQSGTQYIDINSSSAYVYKNITLTSPAVFSGSAWFANRESSNGGYAPWSTKIEIRNETTGITVAQGNTINFTSSISDETWNNSSINSVALPAGTYRIRMFVANFGHLDSISYCFSKDTDGDGTPDHLDLDSDNDGCADALEGDENVTAAQLTSNRISGTVDANNGVPNLVNAGGAADVGSDQGQGIGEAYNAAIQSGCFCYKPAQTTGTALDTNHGITALGRAGDDNSNWPMVRKGAWTVLEAKTKGFVVNRLTNDQINAIPSVDLREGMMVYNITQDCLQINIDGTATGWKCFNTQTCPDL